MENRLRKMGTRRNAIAWIFSLFLWLTASGAAMIAHEACKIAENRAAHGTLALELEEEAVIRESNENDDYRFSFLRDLAADAAENLFVLDKNSILKYDRRGIFLKSFGRKDQGPGELMEPRSLFVDEHDDLFVNDQGGLLHVFDKEGTFRHQIKLDFQIPFDSNAFYVTGEGFIYAFSWDMINLEMKKTFVKADSSGAVILRLKTMDDAG